jgi:hypothetical protein
MATVVGTVIPVAEEWLGIGKETATGTAAEPTATLPVEKIEPDEKYTFLEDNTLRGMMANLFSVTGGTQSAEVDFSGPVYLDTIGHIILNLLGDYTVTGTEAPYTHEFSLLNSSPGQPPTHTVTHYNGVTGVNKAAQYAYWCCSGMSLNMDAEKLFTHDTKGTAYIQQPAASAVTNNFSDVPVYPNWRFAIGINGPASGVTLLSNVSMASLDINREVKPYWTASGQQLPYAIGRNAVSVEGKFTQIAQDESPMLELLNNTQPSIQLAATAGTGANLLSITFDMAVCAFETVQFNNDTVIQYESTFKAVANPTNAGASGGQSPIKVTIKNAVATY